MSLRKKVIHKGTCTVRLSISLSISLISDTNSSFQKVMSCVRSPIFTKTEAKKEKGNKKWRLVKLQSNSAFTLHMLTDGG